MDVVIIYQMLCEVLYFVVRKFSRYYFSHFHLDLSIDYVHFNSIGLVVSLFGVLEVLSRHFVNVGLMLHHGRSNILVTDQNADLSATMYVVKDIELVFREDGYPGTGAACLSFFSDFIFEQGQTFFFLFVCQSGIP